MSNELKVTGGEWATVGADGRFLSAKGWAAENHDVPCVSWVPIFSGKEIVALAVSGRNEYSSDHSELDANARLLAASKKLYEALVLLQHEMIESGNAGSEDFGWSAAIEKTREALAAASGEDQ